MASAPHFYTDYQFSRDEFSDITSVLAQENYGGGTTFATTVSCGGAVSTTGGAMLGHHLQQNFPVFYDDDDNNNNSSSASGGVEGFSMVSDILPRVSVASALPDRLGFSDVAVPSLMDYKMGFNGIARIQNFGGGFPYSDTFEFGEDCCGYVQNFKSICPDSGENWGIQCNQIPAIEHTNIKVGRYTVEERKDRILRYLKKRNQRNFNKTIKYACRKTLADRRVRVRGRFARNNNELCEDETVGKQNDNPLQEKESYCNDAIEFKNDDDDWLQEAVASLMYVPYIAG